MDMYDMICMICNSRLEYLRCTMYGSTKVLSYQGIVIRKYYFRIIILSYENRYSIFVRKYIQYVLRTKVTSYVTA